MTPIDPVALLPFVGEQRAPLLRKLDLKTREDLWYFLPHRHEDRTNFAPLHAERVGQWVTLRGQIQSARVSRWRGGRQVFEITVQTSGNTGNGSLFRGLWFNAYYLPKVMVKGREVIFYGKLAQGKKGFMLVHPEFEFIEDDEDEFIHLSRLTPIYSLTEGLTQRVMRRIMYENVIRAGVQLEEHYPAPPDFPILNEAIATAHFPSSRLAETRARQRLIYDEFFELQCVVVQRRLSRVKQNKPRVVLKHEVARQFLQSLPFQPTGAQRRVMGEIEQDLSLPNPMNRLLQGDVGSGKTLVAVYAMLLAAGQGEQAALMAPTEILAEQHYLNLCRWLEPLGISVGLMTGSRKIYDRSPLDSATTQASLFGGKGSVVVGTHALLFDSFAAKDLGLIVIDEQHKFGVLQRMALAQKGNKPDILVMTATPIPRTLGLTLYGDLDVSILDELPPGRTPIVTACRTEKDLPKVWKFIGEQMALGRQAYVVYPLVEESEKIEAKAAQLEFERIQTLLPHVRVGLMHGKLKPAEKERVMQAFRKNEIQLLVSTTVIEVGVDVPNASIMLVENAERFGLAQLHQLRGRVGRGSEKSYCILAGEAKSDESWKRLKIMEETQDGFRIAEEDLRIRGPGNIFGTEQSGLPPLRWGDLVRDAVLLSKARIQAQDLVQKDPALENWPLLKEKLHGSSSRRKSLASVS
jgi:ATP-dependent DNA helicase RecG